MVHYTWNVLNVLLKKLHFLQRFTKSIDTSLKISSERKFFDIKESFQFNNGLKIHYYHWTRNIRRNKTYWTIIVIRYLPSRLCTFLKYSILLSRLTKCLQEDCKVCQSSRSVNNLLCYSKAASDFIIYLL